MKRKQRIYDYGEERWKNVVHTIGSPDCRLINEGREFRRQHFEVFVGVDFADHMPMQIEGGIFGVSRDLRQMLGVLFREHINVGVVVTTSAATGFAVTHSYLPFGV